MLNLNNTDPLPLDGSEGVYAFRVISDSFVSADIHAGDLVIMRRADTAQPGERAFVWLAETEQAVIRVPQPGDDVCEVSHARRRRRLVLSVVRDPDWPLPTRGGLGRE